MTLLGRVREQILAYLRPNSDFARVLRLRRAAAGASPSVRLRLLSELTEQFGHEMVTSTPQSDRLVALAKTSRRLLPSYRLTWDVLAWFESEWFSRYLDKFGESEGFNAHRRYALQQLLRVAANCPGETAECGVYQGAGSYLIAAANRQAGRGERHHGFDSFAGLSRPADRDGTYWSEGALAASEEIARKQLAEFGDAVQLYPGWIPDRFAEVADRRFRFVHIDVDLHDPTRASLEFFYPRLVPGGILICDDYLFLSCPGATVAVDEFLADKPEKMVGLPGGGGFLMKGVGTAADPNNR